jgi:tyrosyl-tRNA synthetase
MPEVKLEGGVDGLRIANLLKDASLVSSTSEGMRMIRQGAVKIDGEKVSDTALVIKAGAELVIQVGKRRWARVNLY